MATAKMANLVAHKPAADVTMAITETVILQEYKHAAFNI